MLCSAISSVVVLLASTFVAHQHTKNMSGRQGVDSKRLIGLCPLGLVEVLAVAWFSGTKPVADSIPVRKGSFLTLGFPHQGSTRGLALGFVGHLPDQHPEMVVAVLIL